MTQPLAEKLYELVTHHYDSTFAFQVGTDFKAAADQHRARGIAKVATLLGQEATYHDALQRVGHALGLPAGSDITKDIVPRIEALLGVNEDNIQVGGRYNWKGQQERLVYMGRKSYPGNGFWHQFAKVDLPGTVWSEVRAGDLPSFERTP